MTKREPVDLAALEQKYFPNAERKQEKKVTDLVKAKRDIDLARMSSEPSEPKRD